MLQLLLGTIGYRYDAMIVERRCSEKLMLASCEFLGSDPTYQYHLNHVYFIL
jgi:hypothetical protein